MTAINLFTGNRLEILSEALAKVLNSPLASPLDEEVIVVQSQGMERWISMELASYHGICANIGYYFPNSFVDRLMRIVFPDLPEPSPFDPAVMTWQIMKLLNSEKASLIGRPSFSVLRHYLTESHKNLRSYQLACRIADTFDQYLIFRPEMMLKWSDSGLINDTDDWQIQLWRELVNGKETCHRAALLQRFIQIISNDLGVTQQFPQRVSVFGVSVLPRFHMEVLAAISRFTQVNLFLLNPCREFWGDILSHREIVQSKTRKKAPCGESDTLHFEEGNSLLASMGILGREFFDLISSFGCGEEFALFQDPGEGCLLECIQSDILNLRDRQKGKTDTNGMAAEGQTMGSIYGDSRISAEDVSIRIHSCHSPMREIEVLYDCLLDMFGGKDSERHPGDVLVMAPEIETYAPYIQAVFDRPADDPQRIPFSIADRSVKHESRIVEIWLAILDLPGSRFGVSKIMSILETPAVRRKFDLSENDLERIRQWVGDTRISWGIDEHSRSRLNLPKTRENTWMAGLERMLLGYAMAGGDERMFADILPYDDIEGAETVILGKFLDFMQQLFDAVRILERSYQLDEWVARLTDLLDHFFLADEETEREIMTIQRLLARLHEMQTLSDFDTAVDLTVIRCFFGEYFEHEGFGYGFLSGGITFCSMLPMRSIPFKVICLLGMNSDAYPRQSISLGFDLIAQNPRPCDRSRRNDDRYLFLEVLLSARKRLHISYIGQSIRDNSPIPPSVLVSELIDYIERGFELQEGEIRDHLVVPHPLQAFSPRYFQLQPSAGENPLRSEKLFSYSEKNFQAARRVGEGRQPPPAFITRELAVPEESWKMIELADFCRFFHHPARFLLSRRLGIEFVKRAMVLDEKETFAVEGLERYTLEQRLIEKRLAGEDPAQLMPSTRAAGRLPHGRPGECAFERLRHGIDAFARATESYTQDQVLPPLAVDLQIADFRLTGRLTGIYPARMIRSRYAVIKASDILGAWIHHLILNCIRFHPYPDVSMVVGLKSNHRGGPVWTAWHYPALENGEELLKALLKTYWAGLRKPLYFFPETSMKYAGMVIEKKKTPVEALQEARKIWEGTPYKRGEGTEAYYDLCFGSVDPLNSEFEQYAIDIFGPVLKGREGI